VRLTTVALTIPLWVALVSAGCAPRRTLKIRTDPPGAVVRLDDETVGVTPLDLRFYYYGVRRITLQKDGYRTHSEEIELDPVWWSRFPLDFFSEVLLPFGWRDKRKYKVALVKGTESISAPSLHSVIMRADVLRDAGPDGPRDLPAAQPVELPKVDEDSETEEPEEDDRP
jgi:hypothetical protein